MATIRKTVPSAFTVHLPVVIRDRLSTLAESEHRSVAGYIEQLIERDFSRRAEEERVIYTHVAPGSHGPTGEIIRENMENDDDYARRAAIARALFGVAGRDDAP